VPMKSKANIEILPEDGIKLTQEQQNLIALALDKQLPVDDAEFLEGLQQSSQDPTESFAEMSKYFVLKYGVDFGTIFLSAITHGESGYKQTIQAIEEDKAMVRIGKQKN
jgi:hypothetical protein